MSSSDKKYKVIFYCPRESSKGIQAALAGCGFGKVGNYDSWSVVAEVMESFRPLEGSNPERGTVGNLAEVPSHKVELLCLESEISALVAKVKELHPYEEPAIEVIALY